MNVVIGAISKVVGFSGIAVMLWHSSVRIRTLRFNVTARGSITRIPALTKISLVLNGPSIGIVTLMTECGGSYSRGNGGRPL